MNSPSVFGDGNWADYYAKRQTSTGDGTDFSDVYRRLEELENRAHDKTDLTTVLERLQKLEERQTSTGDGTDFSDVYLQLAALRAELAGVSGDKDELQKLKEQVQKLKEQGVDVSELEARIAALESGNSGWGDGSGSADLTSMYQELQGIKNGSIGITATLKSEVDGLKNGNIGQVATNKSEIETLKQRVSTLESNR